jgi:hypothetical protein
VIRDDTKLVASLGLLDGSLDGSSLGSLDGVLLGLLDGLLNGSSLASLDGVLLGLLDGLLDGSSLAWVARWIARRKFTWIARQSFAWVARWIQLLVDCSVIRDDTKLVAEDMMIDK